MLIRPFSTPEEIVQRLCERLRKERLHLQMTQADVAARAGVSTNTVSNLEAGRNISVENLVRIASILGRAQEFETLFLPKLNSIDELLHYEHSSQRQRSRRKKKDA
ncbi:helix-turn-helix domain-containing protein [Alcaligenes endophyticus]|uniref:Helix-turn-helix domain-containing protein n=1 Tax=Alcaligenes endophyticus TaxID=1929088 RepID=A0ABT8EL36_9BURK|nr:helix-turn-helix transcriptional regulator [Alcaligenes endophyticus]MCX5590629.1 helix-turn-helix transcriptional regulator [Alcaligenes endophyticus]MDN4122007.1 helix-turn-helix domain-containing protein [Alcaligenes endophyticus]